MAHQLMIWKNDQTLGIEVEIALVNDKELHMQLHALCALHGLLSFEGRFFHPDLLRVTLLHKDPRIARHAVRISETWIKGASDKTWDSMPDDAFIIKEWNRLAETNDPLLKMQVAYALGEWKSPVSGKGLSRILVTSNDDPYLIAAAISSLHEKNLETVTDICLKDLKGKPVPAYILPLLQTALGHQTRRSGRADSYCRLT